MMKFKIIAKITIVTSLALITIWGVGLYEFYGNIPSTPDTGREKTDAIIVLTGGKDRIAEGVHLLNSGYAQKLLISGVGKETKFKELLQLQNLPAKEVKGIDYAKVSLGHEAINTIGNAKETAEWVKANDIQSIRLVTANYHMPRALLEFRKWMPDLKIIEHPVFPSDFKKQQWRDDELTRRYILSEYTKYLAAQIGR